MSDCGLLSVGQQGEQLEMPNLPPARDAKSAPGSILAFDHLDNTWSPPFGGHLGARDAFECTKRGLPGMMHPNTRVFPVSDFITPENYVILNDVVLARSDGSGIQSFSHLDGMSESPRAEA